MGAKSVQLRVDSNRIRFRAELFRLRRQHSGRSDSSYDARGKYNDHDNHTDSDDNEYDSGNNDAVDYDDNHMVPLRKLYLSGEPANLSKYSTEK